MNSGDRMSGTSSWWRAQAKKRPSNGVRRWRWSLDPLVKKGELAGYDLAARYLPSRKTQQARQASLPDRETLERNLTSAMKGLPFKPSLFQPFLDATEKARTQEPVEMQTFRGTALGLKLDSLLFMHERPLGCGRAVAWRH